MAVFAAIDHLLTVDLGGRNTRQLYAAARDDEPLVEAAAAPLLAAADAGESVLLTTGFPIPPSNQPETDGPLGTVVLAGALADLGAAPVVVTEPRAEPAITAVADALGIEPPAIVSLAPSASTVPVSVLDSHDPGAVVAVEKPGPTADGSYRTAAGEAITSLVADSGGLFDAARERGIPTVAIGDGGNEVGMGGIRSAVETHVRRNDCLRDAGRRAGRCRCLELGSLRGRRRAVAQSWPRATAYGRHRAGVAGRGRGGGLCRWRHRRGDRLGRWNLRRDPRGCGRSVGRYLCWRDRR